MYIVFNNNHVLGNALLHTENVNYDVFKNASLLMFFCKILQPRLNQIVGNCFIIKIELNLSNDCCDFTKEKDSRLIVDSFSKLSKFDETSYRVSQKES